MKKLKALSAKLPPNDADATPMRFEGVRGQRYTEIFLIGGSAAQPATRPQPHAQIAGSGADPLAPGAQQERS